jgi:hypothetical protein
MPGVRPGATFVARTYNVRLAETAHLQRLLEALFRTRTGDPLLTMNVRRGLVMPHCA